jgi:hypothetical protein
MKKIFNKIKTFYNKGDVAFYISLIGPFIMGTIHLVFVIIKFDWILINYCVFSYLMLIFKILQWAIEKRHLKISHYTAGVISMFLILAPMMAAFVLTILFKDVPHYFNDWFIYGYALYGTIKIIFASKGLAKKNKTDKQYVLSFLSLIGALYTMQMMEFNLIMTFGSESDNAMFLIQLFTQGGIFIFLLFVIGLFIHKRKVQKKEVQNINNK